MGFVSSGNISISRRQRARLPAKDVLLAHGYTGASMLKIAKRAKASNETLYNWYGDKTGLFTALVHKNVEETMKLLQAGGLADTAPLDRLAGIGPVLLKALTGEKAIVLNRAAAADPGGDLGKLLANAGRGTVAPLVAHILKPLCNGAPPPYDDPAQAAELYLSLLIGDLQIRRVVGRMPVPDDITIAERAKSALDCFVKIMHSQ